MIKVKSTTFYFQSSWTSENSNYLRLSIRLNPKTFCFSFLSLVFSVQNMFQRLSFCFRILTLNYQLLVFIFWLLYFSFELLYAIRLSFGQALLILIVKQTNYILHIHYTVYCTQYTMYHNLGSVDQKQAKNEDLNDNHVL